MPHICIDIPLPTFSGLYQAVMPSLNLPSFTFPGIVSPLLPNPILGNVKFPGFEMIHILQAFHQIHILGIIKALADPVISFLGLDLDGFFPKIPGTSIGLIGLLTGKADALYAAIKAALAKGVKFPFVPDIIFPSISTPEFQLDFTIKVIVAGFIMLCVGKLFDLCGMLLDMLNAMELPGLPSLPSLPTFPDLSALIKGPSLNLNIPGFPSIPALPSPLIPGIQNPEFDMMENLIVLLNNLTIFPLQLLMDFLLSIAGKFGASFSFPLPCIDI